MSGRHFLIGLFLVDLPVIVACGIYAAAGHSLVDTYNSFSDWRMAHPISYVPSLVLLVWLGYRWRRGRRSPPSS